MVFSSKKRFIAGAICSSCQRVDVVVVFHEDGADWQQCVACGFKQVMNGGKNTPQGSDSQLIKLPK